MDDREESRDKESVLAARYDNDDVDFEMQSIKYIQRLWNILQAFPTVSLLNAAVVLALLILGVARNFVDFSLNCDPHKIIKGNSI